MASPKNSSSDHAAATVAAPAMTTLIIGLNACVHHDRADAVAFLAFAYVNIVLLVLSARWFDHAPPGSEARRVAGIAVFLLMASLIAGFLWKATGQLSLPFKAFFFFLAAALPVAAYIDVVFVLG